ncbi:MAG: hypothetical protein IPH60_15210 [Flavobacteriales bacterium]|nr:hypothetical protein [Flavobacteriales bacterium]
MRNAADRKLYLFYKLYRANVRMKVNAIRAADRKPANAASGWSCSRGISNCIGVLEGAGGVGLQELPPMVETRKV